jgi:hypothetical protein
MINRITNEGRLPRAFLIFLVLASLLGAAAVLASVSLYGPGLTHDSAAYMYAAESLLKGEGFQYFGYPSPFIQWPPLYPLLLAAGWAIGLSPLPFSGAVNAVAHGLIIFIAGRWLFSNLKNKYLAAMIIAGLVFSLPLIQVSRYLWTETLFVLFTLAAYLQLGKYLEKRALRCLISAGVFSALACLDRYMGVTLVITAALFLFFRKNSGFLKRVADTAVYGLISSVPVLIWTARNYIVSGTFVGVRIPSEYPLKLNVLRTAQSIYAWIKPESMLQIEMDDRLLVLAQVFAVILPVVSILALLYLICKEIVRRQGLLGAKSFYIFFNAAFIAIYIVYLVMSATTVAFEPINSRYLVPVFIPAVFIVAISMDYGLTMLNERFDAKEVKVAAVIILLAYLIYPALNTGAALAGYMENGAGGFNTAVWHRNPLIGYMKNIAGRISEEDATYYSSNADAIYALTGVRAFSMPKKNGPDMYGYGQFEAAVQRDEHSYIVWFKGGVPPTLYNLNDIKKLWRLEEVEINEAGAVYRILRK